MKKYFDYYKIITFILFVYSGLLKWIPISFPIDLTIFFGALSLFAFVSYLLKPIVLNELIIYITIFFFLLMWMFLFSNFYSISTKYAQTKSIAILLNIYAFIYPLIVIRKEDFSLIKNVFIVQTIIVLIILSIIYLNDLWMIFFTNDVNQKELLGFIIPSYLSIGTFISVGFLFLLNKNDNFSLLLKVSILFFLVLLSGRGPLFLLILSIICYYLMNNYSKTVNVKFFFIFIILICLAVRYIPYDQINFDRFNVFKNFDVDESTQARVSFIGMSIKSFFEHPIFGLGIGSSGLILMNEDALFYPHNLFLEALIEVGIFGGIIYLTIYILLLYKIKEIRNNEILLILFLILFNHFGQDLKSNSFDGWRISVCWISIFLSIHRFYNTKEFN